MPGGSADAGLHDRMAERLADSWTVAAFDPRGYSRSEAFRRMRANLPVFLEHVLCSFSGCAPGRAALRRGAGRLVIGVGRDSRTLLTALPGVRLADEVGGRLVEFPGGHTGCTEDPYAFAERLRTVLPDRTLQGAPGRPREEGRWLRTQLRPGGVRGRRGRGTGRQVVPSRVRALSRAV
ncbi:hypothetical protein [Streptomyces sp. NPDC001880]